MLKTKWWNGERGEWYVVGQVVLLILIALGPNTWPGVLPWTSPYNWLGKLLGGLLIVSGALLSLVAAFHLGANLTPLPHPKEDGALMINGAYSLVRHPIYSGLIIAALGWALWINGGLALGYVAILFVFFDIKSRREEAWLRGKFIEYSEYQKRVRKLIPFIY